MASSARRLAERGVESLGPGRVVGLARLNVIHRLLSLVDYEDLTPSKLTLPPRGGDQGYVRPPMGDQTFVPEVY